MTQPALQLQPFTPPALEIGRIQVITGTESYQFLKVVRNAILPRIFGTDDLLRLNTTKGATDFGNLIGARTKLMRTTSAFGPSSPCRNMLMLFEATRLAPPEAIELVLTGTTVGLFSIRASQSSSTDTLRAYEQSSRHTDRDELISEAKAFAEFRALIYTPEGRYEVNVRDTTTDFLKPAEPTITWQGRKERETRILSESFIPVRITPDHGWGYDGD